MCDRNNVNDFKNFTPEEEDALRELLDDKIAS